MDEKNPLGRKFQELVLNPPALPPLNLDAVDVLMEARAWIDKGWCQFALAKIETGTEAGTFSISDFAMELLSPEVKERCAIGSIATVVASQVPPQLSEDYLHSWRSPAITLIDEASYLLACAIGYLGPAPGYEQDACSMAIPWRIFTATWNDAEGRTKEEVLAKIDEAIALGLSERTDG